MVRFAKYLEWHVEPTGTVSFHIDWAHQLQQIFNAYIDTARREIQYSIRTAHQLGNFNKNYRIGNKVNMQKAIEAERKMLGILQRAPISVAVSHLQKELRARGVEGNTLILPEGARARHLQGFVELEKTFHPSLNPVISYEKRGVPADIDKMASTPTSSGNMWIVDTTPVLTGQAGGFRQDIWTNPIVKADAYPSLYEFHRHIPPSEYRSWVRRVLFYDQDADAMRWLGMSEQLRHSGIIDDRGDLSSVGERYFGFDPKFPTQQHSNLYEWLRRQGNQIEDEFLAALAYRQSK